MNTTFIMLLALAIFLGAGFGGSFVGGVIYGQSLAENAEDELSPRLGPGGQFPGGGQGDNAGQRGQDASQPNRPGRATQNDTPSEGNQPQGPGGSEGSATRQALAPEDASGDGGTRSAAGRGGISGPVLAVEGDVLTVASPRGDLAVTLSEATAIFKVSRTDRMALTVESRVRVLGSRNPAGGVMAQSVVIVPEGVEGLFVTGVGPGGRQRGQAP